MVTPLLDKSMSHIIVSNDQQIGNVEVYTVDKAIAELSYIDVCIDGGFWGNIPSVIC